MNVGWMEYVAQTGNKRNA